MCEGVDVIPVALYVRHVLYIAFYIVRSVGLFLPDAGLDLQVIDAAFVADAVACAILVGLPFVILEPLGKHGLVFFHHQLTIAVDGDGLQFFGTEDIGIALIVEDAFIAGIFPPADLCCFLDGFSSRFVRSSCSLTLLRAVMSRYWHSTMSSYGCMMHLK